MTNITDWSDDIEIMLEKIRINSVILSDKHKRNFFILKNSLLYYRLPTIIISSVNSILAVGLSAYIGQQSTSITNCILSLIASIIVSIELYLGIQKNTEEELQVSKEYYMLSISIFKMINLERQNRSIDGKSFLDEVYSTYTKLYERSNLLKVELDDNLAKIPVKIGTSVASNSSSSTLSKFIQIGNINCEISSENSV